MWELILISTYVNCINVYLPNAWHCIIFVVPNLTIPLVDDDVVNLGACRFSVIKMEIRKLNKLNIKIKSLVYSIQYK